jgi:hypothetical protein
VYGFLVQLAHLLRRLDAKSSCYFDALTLDGLEAGLDEVLADERTLQVKQGLTAARPIYLPQSLRN